MKRVLAGLAIVATVILAVVAWTFVPVPERVLAADASPGVRIEDRHGVLLRSTRAADGSRTRWVPIAEMDPDLIVAFVAVEDRRFWDHSGIDGRAVARASRDNLRAGRIVSGASTISMQLARLLHPAGRGWRAKASEALWAVRLERHLTKQEILEQYLNRVHLGQAAVGVGAASTLYFGSGAEELSVGEAATLAGLAHAPSRDNPFVSPKRAAARRAVAIARMHRAGAIGRADAVDARAEPLLRAATASPFLAPHFTSHLLADRTIGSVGDAMRTTLDAGLQHELEGEVKHAVDLLASRGVRHGAVVVLDNRTGDVLAWVGSPDFWAERGGQTDMVTSARQPGSALKPFLYALAFDRGTTAATVLPDIPRSYATATGLYAPRNYDRSFRGPVRAREALASSYNVPAVELADRVGAAALLQTLRLAGFESLRRDAEHYGLGLALGNGDVTLLEVANAYRGLANGGVWSPTRFVLAATSGSSPSAGPVAGTRDGRRFASPEAAALVLDVLSDASARIPGFGLETPFEFPFPAAAKTGTSRHFTDNWAVATTGAFTVAVWVGNFGGEPMQGVSGVSGAGPLLHRAMMLTASRYPPGMLATPGERGLVAVDVCRLSGMRATSECPSVREWFLPGTEPRVADTWIRAGRTKLPPEYTEWAAQTGGGFVDRAVDAEPASGASTDGDTGGESIEPPAGFRLVSPLDGDVYRMAPGVPADYASIPLRAAGVTGGPGAVRWYVDGKPFDGGRWRLARGTHVVRAVTPAGDVAEARIKVE
jgi:penicillin-binding protein 1C